ncbi:hypothetical protein EU811_21305 [Arthrobacter sp. TS-15]|nr:hypothetical protein EU811_21305 [Arthrobacter sp. TS-15]
MQHSERHNHDRCEAIVWSLEALGVSDIFGIPGGNVIPLYDALNILTRHEQGAGHAAEGYAAASGRVTGLRSALIWSAAAQTRPFGVRRAMVTLPSSSGRWKVQANAHA